MKPSRCCKPRCKRPPAITYLGRRLCDFHWNEQCRREDAAALADYAAREREAKGRAAPTGEQP
jgi:hypothetical protein